MKIKIYIIAFTFFCGVISAQNLSGIKIALDPGHGFIPGQASNCNDAETKRFESWINHCVVPYLKRYLQAEGAAVITTRTDYDSVGPCITLTERKTIANNANVDWFHSVHHNAYNGASNYSLVLFKQINNQICPNGNPQWPGTADTMSAIMASRLYPNLYTTAGYPRGDFCFLGYNLGVLSTLNMPGTLSEGSFWDYQPEINRLRNTNYLKTEAEILYFSFLQYYKKPLPTTHGCLVGVLTNAASGNPINGAKVVISSVGKQVFTDSLNNGFYRFDSLAPGAYTVKAISINDTATANVTVLAGRINKLNVTINQVSIPADVKIKHVSMSGTNLYVRWAKTSGSPDYYDIYATDNSNSWPASPTKSIAATDSIGMISGLTGGKPYFVKMKARNNLGSSPNFSKIFSAGVFGGTDKCLIVDGFNRYGGSGSYQQPNHPFIGSYGAALKTPAVTFESVANTYITDNSFLTGYNYVIWILGDESTIDETLSALEQGYVSAYLKQGGKLLISGSELAWDLDYKGTTADKDFFNKYLKAKYIADNPTPNTPAATGVQGGIFNNIGSFSFGQTYPEDYPDVYDTSGGGVPILRYNSTQTAGVAFQGVFPAGVLEGKLVNIGFGLETISDTAQFNKLVNESFRFFKGVTDVKNEVGTPDNFILSAFPNPFNNSTNLTVQVPRQAKYDIGLYDILGSRLLNISTCELNAGLHKFSLDLSQFSSGVYFVRVHNTEVNSIVKLILMK